MVRVGDANETGRMPARKKSWSEYDVVRDEDPVRELTSSEESATPTYERLTTDVNENSAPRPHERRRALRTKNGW